MVFLFIGLVLILGGYSAYRSVPPYYYQSKLFFMLNEEKLQALADRFQQENIKKIEFALFDTVKVEFNGDEVNRKLSEDEKAAYKKLLSDARVSPVWKIKSGTLFYIGSSSKFGTDFQIAYVLLDSVTGNEPICDNLIINEPHGICLVLLDNNWSIHYQWMNI